MHRGRGGGWGEGRSPTRTLGIVTHGGAARGEEASSTTPCVPVFPSSSPGRSDTCLATKELAARLGNLAAVGYSFVSVVSSLSSVFLVNQ